MSEKDPSNRAEKKEGRALVIYRCSGDPGARDKHDITVPAVVVNGQYPDFPGSVWCFQHEQDALFYRLAMQSRG